MNKVFNMLPALVVRELAAANDEFPPFQSLHEGYAVMLEEFEETLEALTEVECRLNNMWKDIRLDRTHLVESYAADISNYAQHTAAEAIQVAAMAKKMLAYIDSTKEGNA